MVRTQTTLIALGLLSTALLFATPTSTADTVCALEPGGEANVCGCVWVSSHCGTTDSGWTCFANVVVTVDGVIDERSDGLVCIP